MTVIELVIVLAIMSLLAAGAFGLANRGAYSENEPRLATRIAMARREAISTGRQVRLVIRDSRQSQFLLALPDGSVLTHAAWNSADTLHGNAP